MTTQTPLEQVFATHGDALYQAALLLTLDSKRAEQALLRAARILAAKPPAAPNEISVYTILLGMQPKQQSAPNSLPWPATSTDARLLAALAHLPTEQRLALDLLLRHDYTFPQVAPIFGSEFTRPGQLLQDALLALAPLATPDVALDVFTGSNAPECQQTRALLATEGVVAFDPAMRGHLLTCSSCRSAEQAWLRLRAHVERALRAALRDLALPPRLQADIAAAFAPRTALTQRLLKPRALQIALPVAVLLVVAALILPGRIQPSTAGNGSGPATRTPPRELVQKALTNLYTPTAGDGAWHSSYEMRWNFADNLYATLVGDLWMEGGGKYRAQLVHRDGGAPYEFLLSDGGDSIWYSSTALYGTSIYGAVHAAYPNQLKITALPEQRAEAWRERLTAGAWGLAGTYLRDGLAAPALTTWGRQRAADGSEQMVVGFTAVSPLGIAADVPNAAVQPTTILLTIDLASNRLREVREVSGPAGGEQVSRTTWRQLLDTQLPLDQARPAFRIETAFNGPGQFTEVVDSHGLADPALPMIAASSIQPATDSISQYPGDNNLPAKAPAGTDRALVLAPNQFGEKIVVYLGPGRLLLLNQVNSGVDSRILEGMSKPYSQRIERANRQILLVPDVGQRFAVNIHDNLTPDNQRISSTFIQAFGFDYTEMLAIADSNAPFDIDSYIANVRLFRTPEPHDPQAFAALIAALQPQPLAVGQAQHTVLRTTQLQSQFNDALADPYHLPYYPNGPTETTDLWVKQEQAGQIAYWQQSRDQQGTITRQSSASSLRQDWYDRSRNSLFTYTDVASTPPLRAPIIEPTWSVVNLLGCGGTSISTEADGTRVITQIDTNWISKSCNRSQYGPLLVAQFGGPQNAPQPLPPNYNGYTPAVDEGPYLIGAFGQPLYNRIFINSAGRAFRYEARAGSATSPLILESSEILSDTVLPISSIPTDTFDRPPPAALITTGTAQQRDAAPRSTQILSLTDVITRLTTPLWYLPPSVDTELQHVYGVTGTPSQFLDSVSVFDGAMRAGFAFQLAYTPPISDTDQVAQYIYVGPAEKFGAYLRSQRAWKSSELFNLEIDGQQVSAWNITANDGHQWTLLERDGTLIAVDTSTPERFDRLRALRRYVP